MDWLPVFAALLLGFVIGLLSAYALRLAQAKTATELKRAAPGASLQ